MRKPLCLSIIPDAFLMVLFFGVDPRPLNNFKVLSDFFVISFCDLYFDFLTPVHRDSPCA